MSRSVRKFLELRESVVTFFAVCASDSLSSSLQSDSLASNNTLLSPETCSLAFWNIAFALRVHVQVRDKLNCNERYITFVTTYFGVRPSGSDGGQCTTRALVAGTL